MKIIFLPLLYLFELIRENPLKVITIPLCIIFYTYAGTFPDIKNEKIIIKEIPVNDKWVYIYEDKDGLESFYENEKIKLVGKNNNIHRYETYSGTNVLLYFGFIVSLIIIFVCLINPDGRWDFERVFKQTMNYYIRCEIEDTLYVYTIFNRLISKETNMFDRFSFTSVKDILVLPKYKYKIDKRNDKLNEILN